MEIQPYPDEMFDEAQRREYQNEKVEIPEGAELIDDVFYVWKSRFGLYSTMKILAKSTIYI